MNNRLLIVGGILSIYLIIRENINKLIESFDWIEWMDIEEGYLLYTIASVWGLIISIHYCVSLFKGTKSNHKWLSFLFIVLIIYSLDRFYFHYWRYVPYGYSLKFFDIILLAGFFETLTIVITLLRTSPKEEKNDSIFKLQRPLSDIKDDEFSRNIFVEKIVQEIEKSHFEEAFSMGIVGKWATGKSTFIHFIKQKISKENVIVIDFKPWLSSDVGSVTKHFLNLLKENLSKYDKNFSHSLNDYYRSLVQMEGNIFSKTINMIGGFFSPIPSVEEEFEEINQGLKTLNKQVFIFIDDLDRLDSPEVIEVFKLIRNTANFRNMVYITAFDRAYVINAVKNFNDYNPHLFIDKIFDFEFALPEYDNEFVIKEINKFIEENLKFDFAIRSYSTLATTFKIFINSKRDVGRFKSTLYILNVDAVKELDKEEFIYVELIRHKYPQVLNFIYTHIDKVINIPAITTPTSSFSLISNEENVYIRVFLSQNEKNSNSKFNLSDIDIESIVSIFNHLFGEQKSDGIFTLGKDEAKFKENSIVKSGYLDAYFQLILNDKTFPFASFYEQLISLDFEGLKKDIKEITGEDTSRKSRFIFSVIESNFDQLTSDQKAYENSINTLLLMEERGIAISRNLFARFFHYEKNVKDLFSSEKELKKTLIGTLTSEERFSSTTRSKLINSYLRDELKGLNEYKFLLSKTELERINTKIFKRYIDSCKQCDQKLLELYYYNYHAIEEGTNKVIINKEVNKAFRRYIDKHRDAYFNYLPRPRITLDIEGSYVFEPFIPQIFGSWDEFEKFLYDGASDEYKNIDILKGYYQKFKKSDYTGFTLNKDEKPLSDFVFMRSIIEN